MQNDSMENGMGRVLLIYPSYTYPRKSPPLGLASLAAYIEPLGFTPVVLDLNVDPVSDEDFKALLASEAWIAIGLSFMTSQFAEARRLAELIKTEMPDVPLIAGGPHASSIPARTMEELPWIDLLVVGEGELVFASLLQKIQNDESYRDQAGLAYRDDGRVIVNDRCELVSNLDELPFPAWKYFDITKYNVFSIEQGDDAPVFALLSSRGCPNVCTFCDSHTIFKRKFRPRSAENLYSEVEFLHEKYGMTQFDFVDDLITVQKKRVLKFCDLLRASGVDYKWMANARVNTVDEEMLTAMRDAGCIRVDFGVETGDPEVRRLMRKNITEEQIVNAHKLAQKVGLSTGSFTMVGNLGETKESAAMTVRLLQEIGDDVMVAIACPFPGTELYQTAKEKGYILTEDWDRYVTSPTYTDGYKPVMRSEHMTPDDILDAYYYIHSYFARRKFQRRFGRFFYFNPKFYKEWVFQPEGLARRFKMGARLIWARLKGGR